MNWDAIGAIAEVMGATTVVITLAFLTIETRRNRLTAESASIDSLGAGWNALNVHVMSDPDLCELWNKGYHEPASLNEVQLTRFMLMGQSYVNHFMTVMKHHDAGTLPEQQWVAHSAAEAQLMCSPGGRWLRENIAITPEVEEFFRSFDDRERKETLLGVAR